MSWRALAHAPSGLGESPFWHPGEAALYWVDIPGRAILRLRLPGGTLEQCPLPQDPGCIAPALAGGLVVGLRDGVYRARAWRGALEPLHRFGHDTASMRCNDGKADALGRMWVGTIVETKDRPAAGLYAIDCRHGAPDVRRMADGAITANGLAWSPDATTLYWADTQAHTVWAWDWDAPANRMRGRRVFLQFPRKPEGWMPGMPGYGGRPDGAAVDREGHYWCAMYEGGRVLKFSPAGQLLEEFRLPALCPTMPCFGDADGRTLYVTTARHGRSPAELDAHPDSGRVFSMRVDAPGLPVNFFRD